MPPATLASVSALWSVQRARLGLSSLDQCRLIRRNTLGTSPLLCSFAVQYYGIFVYNRTRGRPAHRDLGLSQTKSLVRCVSMRSRLIQRAELLSCCYSCLLARCSQKCCNDSRSDLSFFRKCGLRRTKGSRRRRTVHGSRSSTGKCTARIGRLLHSAIRFFDGRRHRAAAMP